MKYIYLNILFTFLIFQNVGLTQNWVDVGPKFKYGFNTIYSINNIGDSSLYALGNFININDTTLCAGVASFQNNIWTGQPEMGQNYFNGNVLDGSSDIISWGNQIIFHAFSIDTDTIVNGQYRTYNLIKSLTSSTFDTIGSTNSLYTYFKTLNNELYSFGWFGRIGGNECRGLAKYNGTTWDCLNPPFGFGGPQINDIFLFDNKLWVGGNFSNAQSEPFKEIAYLDLTDSTWHDLDSGIRQDVWARIDVFQEYQGKLYIGGVFRYDMGNAGHMIMSWNPQTQKFSDVGGGIFGENYAYSSLAQVQDMIVFEDKLWVSGLFDWAGGIKHPSIAVWDGTNWCTFGDSIETRVWDMEIFQDELYILTDFINGDTINKVAKWIGGNFRDTCGTFPLWPHGIKESTTDNIQVYPNPTDNQLTILTKSLIRKIEVSNSHGLLIKRYFGINALSFNIQLEGLPNGLYFLRIKTEEDNVTKKILKTSN